MPDERMVSWCCQDILSTRDKRHDLVELGAMPAALDFDVIVRLR